MKQLVFARMTCVLVACSVQSGECTSKREHEPVSPDTLHPLMTTFMQVNNNLRGRRWEFVSALQRLFFGEPFVQLRLCQI